MAEIKKTPLERLQENMDDEQGTYFLVTDGDNNTINIAMQGDALTMIDGINSGLADILTHVSKDDAPFVFNTLLQTIANEQQRRFQEEVKEGDANAPD